MITITGTRPQAKKFQELQHIYNLCDLSIDDINRNCFWLDDYLKKHLTWIFEYNYIKFDNVNYRNMVKSFNTGNYQLMQIYLRFLLNEVKKEMKAIYNLL